MLICWDFEGNLPFTGIIREVYGLPYATSTATFAELGCERGSRGGREYNHPHLLPRPTRRRFLCSQMQIAAGWVGIMI